MPMRLYGDGRRKIARIYQSGLRHRRNHQISIYRLSLSCSPRRPRPSGACREGEIIGNASPLRRWPGKFRLRVYEEEGLVRKGSAEKVREGGGAGEGITRRRGEEVGSARRTRRKRRRRSRRRRRRFEEEGPSGGVRGRCDAYVRADRHGTVHLGLEVSRGPRAREGAGRIDVSEECPSPKGLDRNKLFFDKSAEALGFRACRAGGNKPV